MPKPGKLGKLAAERPHSLSDLAVYVKGKMPTPPASVDYYRKIGRDWGMLGNDQYGDCTIAGAGHAIMAWNAEVAEPDPVPNAHQVLAQYMAITGGQDTGCVEANVLTFWNRQGLFGDRDKIAAFVPVDIRNLVTIHQAIAFYGCAYIGVALPESAEQQFEQGQPWTVVNGSPVVGGHCVLLVGYDQNAVYAVTWGAVVPVSYPWLATYMDECWAMIPEQFVQAGKGPELDLAQLQSDLNSLRL